VDELGPARVAPRWLGRPRASQAFALILLAAFLLQLGLPVFSRPRSVWLGLAGAPLAWAAARRAIAAPDHTGRIIAAQRWTLQSFVLLSLGTAAGLLLAPG
jgi:1,4-dihydroxy-2-naphthoate octaprenyltransferase